jgi:hypothetical protein
MGDASEASKKKIWQMYSSVLAALINQKKWPVYSQTINYSERAGETGSRYPDARNKLREAKTASSPQDNQQVQDCPA